MGTMRGGWTVLWVMACMVVHEGASMSRAGAAAQGQEQSRHVQEQCGFTRYPTLCVRTLARSGSGDFLSALVNKTILETKLPSSYFAEMASLFQTQGAQHTKAVTDHCEDTMTLSLKRLEQSLEALKEPGKNKGDVQTWLSAAMTLQESCKDSARGLGPRDLSSDPAARLSRKMDYLAQLTSNALALVNRIPSRGKPAKTDGNRNPGEKRGFPSWMSKRDRRLLEGAAAVKANAVVAKDGTGNYMTVSAAIQAASGGRFVIYVKAGLYKEKIHANKDGITLIGDGKYSTIITGDDSAAGGSSTSGSSTFTITGDGFIARDIGFQNTAGPQGDQAVALTVNSDRSVLYRCSIAGYQDTLYALALRQFYRECDIYGTVDFIFGNAAAVFQNCELVVRKPGNKDFTVILANGRSDPGQNTGFSIQRCHITSSSGSVYLGRPWKYYSRAVVMQSTIGGGVAARGWIEWPGYGSSVLRTLYFAEYANQGPGAGTSGRVKWPGFHVIGAQEAMKFTVQSLISGNSWLPSTGVAFTSGL